MLCLIQTLNLFNTYLHLRCPVIHPRCHYCISSLDGLGKGANWRTIGQLGHGTFPNFITFGLLSQNTMSHNEIVFFSYRYITALTLAYTVVPKGR